MSCRDQHQKAPDGPDLCVAVNADVEQRIELSELVEPEEGRVDSE